MPQNGAKTADFGVIFSIFGKFAKNYGQTVAKSNDLWYNRYSHIAHTDYNDKYNKKGE